MNSSREVVLIMGAGPVGLVATASLISRGIPVKLLESLRSCSRFKGIDFSSAYIRFS